MIAEAKLDFWIKNNYNVLFIGKHGVGKTSAVVQAFDRAGLKWKYFSASTLDPWVDIIGVPKERISADGSSYLDLVRPKELANDEVHAVFFDEYNRCITGDTKIPLADGTVTAIKDLVGKDYFYVYSYDIIGKKVVISKGHSARMTRKNEKIIKITLDNGESIKTTLDHPFLCRSGEYVEGQNLKIGDSLMPFNRRFHHETALHKSKDGDLEGYEEVYHPDLQEWEFTHRLSDEYNLKYKIYSKNQGGVRHHKDFNKLNNSPENIVRMFWKDHFKLHSEKGSVGGKKAQKKHPDLWKNLLDPATKALAVKNSTATRQSSKKYKKIRSELSKNINGTPERRVEQAELCREGWESGQFDFDQSKAHRKRTMTITITFGAEIYKKINLLTPAIYIKEREELIESLKDGRGKTPIKLENVIELFGSFEIYVEKIKAYLESNNHKIISIEYCGQEDTYDFSVDNYYNFAVEAGVFVHNSHKKVRNAVMELIQFKSINGKKFNNLRVVWAAINPDDDEDNSYDVEVLDPAQLDRFQVHVQVPYLPSEKFFTEKYSKEHADAAISWWKDLPDDMKNEISPRRLDYALDMYQKEGDLRDILPAKSNISKLKLVLESGPIQKQINEAIKTPESAKKFISSENNYAASILHIIKDAKYMEVFLPLITSEKLSSLLIVHESVRDYLAKNAAKQPLYSKVISDVIQANQSKKIVNKLKKMLSAEARKAVNSVSSGVPYMTILKGLKTSRDDVTPYRERIYNLLKKEFPQNPSAEEAIETLNILADKVISRTHPNTIGHMCPGVERIVSTCLTIIAKKDSLSTPSEVISKYNSRWEVFDERLNRKVKFRPELLIA